MRFRPLALLLALSALLGCSAQFGRPRERQEASPAKEKNDLKPSAMPTFTYRPGG
jgi:hypothetical protein